MKYKYSFGREINSDRLPKETLYLPIDKNEQPDWDYMESFIEGIKNKIQFPPIKTKNVNLANKSVYISNWKEFKVSDLFEVTGSETTKLPDLEMKYGYGEYPYITTQSTNNGIAGFYNHKTESANVLTADSAITGFIAYQDTEFTASDHVEILKPKRKKTILNKYTALFLKTIFSKGQYKYGYGRKFNQSRIKDTILIYQQKTMSLIGNLWKII